MLRFVVAIGAICSARALPYDDLNEDDALTPEQTALIEKSDAFSEREIAEAGRSRALRVAAVVCSLSQGRGAGGALGGVRLQGANTAFGEHTVNT